jgi:hypothetical protein
MHPASCPPNIVIPDARIAREPEARGGVRGWVEPLGSCFRGNDEGGLCVERGASLMHPTDRA